jgi:hypothetical protein
VILLRVLFVFPLSVSAVLNILGTSSALGLVYLASSLEREGAEVRILDESRDHAPKDKGHSINF